MAAKKKKLGGKAGPVMEKKVIPAETDTTKLVNYVCGSNIMKTGEDVKVFELFPANPRDFMKRCPFQLKPDSEYPDWLWELPTGGPRPLEELDSDTKEYWRRLRKMALRRNNKMQKLKSF